MEHNLDLDALRPENKSVTIRGVVYPVPSEITIDTMAELVALEQTIKGGGDGDAQKVVAAAKSAKDQIQTVLQLETPEAVVDLSLREVLLIIAFLSGSPDGAEAEVQAALAPPGGGDDGGDGEDAATGDGNGATPLRSAKRSRSPSSSSAKPKAGHRATGARAPGATSRRTSATTAGKRAKK